MNNILRLLNDYLVLKEYKADDEAQGVYDDLLDEVQQNMDEANTLMEYASDFQNSFKELRNLGIMGVMSATNIRIYIGEIIETINEMISDSEK